MFLRVTLLDDKAELSRAVVPSRCVLVHGIGGKDAERDEVDDAVRYELFIPAETPHKS